MSSWANILIAISDTLTAATGIKSVRGYNEITESIPATECPRLQVYPDSLVVDANTGTDRTTFQVGIQQYDLVVFVDHFARPVSHIYLDMIAMVEGLDGITDVLQDQKKPPFFGISDIKSFNGWTWKRMTFRYGDMKYRGGRFTLKLRIF